ncbi:MAG: sulfurtransferase [Deltaproteobacteria bacterium HGW-Deltaproteobacteria-22]|nr:MAG: sulfurtransferase [Deltaproteobacteria bacterium HGW-Deltaproteobacteria-22]
MDLRITSHPILAPLPEPSVPFTFNDRACLGRPGEMISSALYAAGVHVFGHHPRDNGAQGIFCVNGQCSQCMVLADGVPVKACMTPVSPGMRVLPCEGLPDLPDVTPPASRPAPRFDETSVTVLIVGGGPAGMCAAVELGRLGIDVLLIDDKAGLGGKLTLQTHNFFGSVKDCYAGVRGIDIARILGEEIAALPSVHVWREAAGVGVYSDGAFGIVHGGHYRIVRPAQVLIATGARERTLPFPGSDLPGVYGAGAFQTLVNRDLVKASGRLFVVGGGNVGLITAYHALQAGIEVAAVVEALPACGGYKVHQDKILRLGIPVLTSHSIVCAEGTEHVQSVVAARIDADFRPIPGTERRWDVDTVLVAVGLSPVDELAKKAKEYGIPTWSAGDAREIAEASAAIFSGKIAGRKIARELGILIDIPDDWEPLEEILKSRPGTTHPITQQNRGGRVFPVFFCDQEIPCNPCVDACPLHSIQIPGTIMDLPVFEGKCSGCGKCVLACPGLAVSQVFEDTDKTGDTAVVMLAFEFDAARIPADGQVITTDRHGRLLGTGTVLEVRDKKNQDRRKLVRLRVPAAEKLDVAGFLVADPDYGRPLQGDCGCDDPTQCDPIVCLCERVRRSEVLAEIEAGVRDMNLLKASLRTGMGACGGKNCTEPILRLYRSAGVKTEDVTPPTFRPLTAEVRLDAFLEDDR